MYLNQLYMAPMQAVRTPECHPSQLCSFWLDVKHGRRKDTEHLRRDGDNELRDLQWDIG